VDVERISKWERGTETGSVIASIAGLLRQSDDPDTGLIIESDGITWPLDLSHDPAFPARARSLISQRVIVNGRIERAPGRELPPKTVVLVHRLSSQTGME
jgi:hypothetical protein